MPTPVATTPAPPPVGPAPTYRRPIDLPPAVRQDGSMPSDPSEKIVVIADVPKRALRKLKLLPGGESIVLLDRERYMTVTLDTFLQSYDRVVLTIASDSARLWLQRQLQQLQAARDRGVLVLGLTRAPRGAELPWEAVVQPHFMLHTKTYGRILHECEYRTGPLSDTISAMQLRIPPPEGWWARLRRFLTSSEAKIAAGVAASTAAKGLAVL